MKNSPTKGIIYYTDNRLDIKIAQQVQEQLRKADLPIVCVSLRPMENTLGDSSKYIVLPLQRGYLTMFKQILTALEASDSDIIFFCEHDVLYPKEYFEFIPSRKDTYYYNVNWWRVRLSDGFAVSWRGAQTSGLCAYRDLLLEHYKKRLSLVEKNGYSHSIGFEPGPCNPTPQNAPLNDGYVETWESKVPQVDIKHNKNLSENKWSIRDFRDKTLIKYFRTGECPEWAKEIVAKMK